MNAILIDTSTELLAVAYIKNDAGVRVLSRKILASGLNHAALIVPTIEDVWKEGDPTRKDRVDTISIALGPGSFTGLRIGLATAKGLASGWNIPLVGVDSLAAMVSTEKMRTNLADATYVSVVDARKQRFYVQIHRPGAESQTHDWSAEDLKNALQNDREVVLTGYQGDLLAQRIDPLPAHWKVCKTTDWVEALAEQTAKAYSASAFLSDSAGPRYLRLSEAEEYRLARENQS